MLAKSGRNAHVKVEVASCLHTMFAHDRILGSPSALAGELQVGGVWIAPIYSWYHASFDREPDIPGAPAVENVSTPLHPCCFQPNISKIRALS